MRQVIISELADVFAATAGTTVLQIKDANGQGAASTDTATLAAAGEMRVARKGATTSDADDFSPWMRGNDILSVDLVSWADIGAESHVATFVGSTAGKTATLKVIMTTQGYEPFTRHNIEFVSGATAIASATACVAAFDAQTKGFEGVLSMDIGTTPGTDDHIVTIVLKDGERAAIAFDAGESDIVITVPKTNAVEPVGTPAMLRELEIAQAGRTDGNYDRLNPFAAEVATNIVAASDYDIISVRYKNSAEGQIRGVDNVRELSIALKVVAGDVARDAFIVALKGFSELA